MLFKGLNAPVDGLDISGITVGSEHSRISLCGVVASPRRAEYAVFPQSRASKYHESFSRGLFIYCEEAYLSHISVCCVRSQRILREKQFWHVFDNRTGGEPRWVASKGAGTASDIAVVAGLGYDIARFVAKWVL